ncbi:hypothetical protein [Aetokthonos hydrillicola]|uniref:hypothetical protein n=1 Tax=Aetokthonos hydrillicola TaxID=1550245 RepID=UPI001ABBDE95
MNFPFRSILDTTNSNHQIHTTVEQHDTQPYTISTSDLLISAFPIGFFIGWTGFFIVVSKIRRSVVDKMIVTTNSLQKMRCQNYQFYSNNRYLNCAVQPSIVLTKDAENCPDYCPTHKNFHH